MVPFAAVRRFLLLLIAAAVALPVSAQDVAPSEGYDPPAHIAFVEGVALLERDGASDESPMNMPLLAGDRIRTRAGRVEVLFADGSTLHLDHHTIIDLQSDELVRLTEGRIRLSIPGRLRSVAYRIDGPHGWVSIDEPGDYRVALLNGPRGRELELAVLRGRAELANEGGATALRAGERALVTAGSAPSYAYVVNSAAWDAFDRWSEARRDERLRASAEYLPDEVRPYAATLSQHGSWRHEPTYGMVWYPRVEVDWRPYYRGRWVSLRPYGWTWVAYDPWGWPTHHYGRWGYGSGAWFWIPGRTWGAAWVSWAYAPGYVSWCPLGWNNRPVFAININIGRGYDPWRAWTVIPRHSFGVGFVHRSVVRVDRLDLGVRQAFVHRDRAPEIIGRAVPRGGAPIRVAGTRDGRRGATPLYTNVSPDRNRVTSDGPRVRVQGAPDAGGRTGATAVPRDRAVPTGPAVRSQRSSDARPSAPAPQARPDVRSYGSEPSRNDSRGDASAPRGARPRIDRDPGNAQPPSGITRDPRGARTPVDAGPRAVPRTVPRSDSVPVYRSTPSDAGQRMPRDGGGVSPSGSSDAPVRRAVPRAEPIRPQGDDPRPSPGMTRSTGEYRRPEYRQPSAPDRPRAVERRGPDRPSAGASERRAPTEARPPQAGRPDGGAASSPPAGARQRPSGQPSRGTAVRRPGGGGN